jgi:tRNA-Thr(GGU) m(6)t(6)A37 methyltransferase TsaA
MSTLHPVTYTPIGIIHSSFTELAGMPIQAVAAQGVPGWIDIDPAYREGLQDLEGFSHLYLIYHLHRVPGGSLKVVPFLDEQPRGVFATRAPRRPNPIGISVVRLMSVQDVRLEIEDVDVVEGTPLLDIKPYVPEFDVRAADRIGWFAGHVHRTGQTRADRRFT